MVTKQLGIRYSLDGDAAVKAKLAQIGQAGEDVEKRVGGGARRAGRDLEQLGITSGNVSRLIGRAFAGLSVYQLSRDFIEVNRSVQSLEARLTFLTGSAQGAAEAMGYITDTAKRQSIDIFALGDAYAKLQTFVNSGKLSLEEMRQLLEGMNDISKVHGLSVDRLNDVYYGLSQALSQSTVQLQELNQVVEPVPGLLDGIAKQAGVTSGEFRKMVGGAQVTSAAFKQYLIAALNETSGASERMADTLDASFTRLKNSYNDLLINIGKTGIVDGLVQVMDLLSQATAKAAFGFETITLRLGQFGVQMGAIVGLIDRDVAALALTEVSDDKILEIGQRWGEASKQIEQAASVAPRAATAIDRLGASSGKAAKEAKKLASESDSLKKRLISMLQDQRFENNTFGLDETEKQLVAIERITLENADAFNKLGNEGERIVKALKDAVKAGGELEETQKRGEAAAKAAADALEAARDEYARAQEAFERPFIQAAENIQDAFADAFADILENGIGSFSDLGNAIKHIMAQAVAQSVTANLLSGGAPVFGGSSTGSSVLSSWGGALSSGGASNLLSSINPLSSISNVLAGTSVGAAINTAGTAALPSLFGSGGLFSGAVGAVGPQVPGALGALGLTPASLAFAVAAIALPKIIKAFSGPRAHPASTFGGIYGTGGFQSVDFRSKHLDDSFGQSASQAISTIFSALQGAGVGGLSGLAIHGGVDDGRGFFSTDGTVNGSAGGIAVSFDPNNAEDMANAALKMGIELSKTATIANEDLKKALDNVQVGSKKASEILNDLAYAAALPELRKQFNEQVGDAIQGIENPTALALKKLEQEFAALRLQATQLGGDLEQVEKLYTLRTTNLRKQFGEQISDAILGMVNPTALALKQLDREFADLRQQAKELGTDIGQVDQLYRLRISAVVDDILQKQLQAAETVRDRWGAAVQSIGQLRAGLRVDARLSPLSPEGRLEEAARQFNEAAGKAQAGDVTAIEQLDGVTRQYLDLARSYFGSTEDYAQIFSRVQGVLGSTESLAVRQLREAEKQTALLQQIASAGGGAANDNWTRAANPELARALVAATNYTGSFGGGKFEAFARSNAVSDAQREAAREIVRRFGFVPGFANGGVASGMALVGERGPELVRFDQPARVYSNNDSRRMLSAGNDNSGVVTQLQGSIRVMQAGFLALVSEMRDLRQENKTLSANLDRYLRKVG